MSLSEEKPVKKNSRYKKYFIFLVVIGIAIFLYLSNQQDDYSEETSVVSDEVATSSLVVKGPIMVSSEPVSLSIPKINLKTNFEVPLGLSNDGELVPPKSFDQVGWYKHSPTPGALGPAVVLGHVDSKLGPAIFFSLGQLQVGDDIFIDRKDGSVAHFKVDFFERYEQKEFPTEKIYGNIDHAGLRLVTCSGIYLRGQQKYTHNLVVYARLVE